MDKTIAEECYELSGHLDRIWATGISSDKRWLCSCSSDGNAKIYKLNENDLSVKPELFQNIYIESTTEEIPENEENKQYFMNDEHDNDNENEKEEKFPTLRSCSFNYESDKLVLGCYDSKAYIFALYKTKTGKEFWCLYGELTGHQKEIKSVAFSRSGRIATCSRDKFVHVWREELIPIAILNDTEYSNKVGNENENQNIDESEIEKATENDIVLHPNITTEYTLTGTLEAHLGDIKSVAFSQDSQFLMSTSYDNTIRLYKRHIDETDAYVTTGLCGTDEIEEDWFPYSGVTSSQKPDYFLNTRDDMKEIMKAPCHTVWTGKFIGNNHFIVGDASGVLRLFEIDKVKADLNQVAVETNIHEFGRPIYALTVDWIDANSAAVFSVSSDNSLVISRVNVSVAQTANIGKTYKIEPLLHLPKVANGEINAVDILKVNTNEWVVALGGDDCILHVLRVNITNIKDALH